MRFELALLLCLGLPLASRAADVMQSRWIATDIALSADPASVSWKNAPAVIATGDAFGREQPEARTEVRSLWTDRDLYFLFVSHFETLYPRTHPNPKKEVWGLWDYDVAEVFIGDDFKNIEVYKEFEVSPDGEFVDLAVDRRKKGNEVDWTWNSGFQYKTRIDRQNKIWVCEMRIPWKTIDRRAPVAGNELRLNLYRIEGGPPHRKEVAWQAVGNPSFHTPERFGRLRLIH